MIYLKFARFDRDLWVLMELDFCDSVLIRFSLTFQLLDLNYFNDPSILGPPKYQKS